MKTMNLDTFFSNNGGIESLFDAAGDENDQGDGAGNEFDNPFYAAQIDEDQPTVEELEQNIDDLAAENDELNTQIEKQKTENFEQVSRIEELEKELEQTKAELEQLKEKQENTFMTEKDQKAGKMTIDDDSSDEKEDRMNDDRIDVNPSDANANQFAGSCWICCGFKIM